MLSPGGGPVVQEADQELINAHELARALDLSVDTIWRYTRENKIPYLKLGGKQYRYRLGEVVSALSGDTGDYSKFDSKTLCKTGCGTGMAAEEQKGYEAIAERVSYEDYLKLPQKEGYSYEVLDGMLVKDPSPNVFHQRIVPRLWAILDSYFKTADPDGEVFIAPLDVTLGSYTVVQPDLLYVSGKHSEIVCFERIDGAPDLVVEVISKPGAGKDRIRKKKIYQDSGIQHYWMIDPAEQTLECYSLRDGLYAFIAGGAGNDIVEHPEFEGLKLELIKIWNR